jgi:hypothetical protein
MSLAALSIQAVAHPGTAEAEAEQGEPLQAGKAVMGPVLDWAVAGAMKLRPRASSARCSVENFIVDDYSDC